MITPHQISDEDILSIIDVNKPYYALKDLTFHNNGTITAIIPIEQHLGFEPIPITSSESGRHLAVLGSCVCALHNPSKTRHYYLASSANATRKDFDFMGPQPDYFTGWAKCLKVDGKSAQALTVLKFPDGRVYSEIVVDYHVLNHRVFERINQSRQHYTSEISINPYIKEPEIEFEILSDNKIISRVENISAKDCAGHFPYIPAVPIAILFRILVKLSILLMQIKKGNPKLVFCVKECTTEAKNLAFPGERIDIEAQFIHTDENEYHYIRTTAYTNCNCCVGVIDIILFEVKL